MNLFLDTNAVVKLYHEELGTKNLTDFIYPHSDNLIMTISDLTAIEFHSAFLRCVRIGEIELSVAEDVFRAFDEDLRLLNIVEVNNQIKKFAIKLLDSTAHERALRTLDAIQLSAAIVSHQTVTIDYFICSDKKLLNVAKEYFTVFNPEN